MVTTKTKQIFRLFFFDLRQVKEQLHQKTSCAVVAVVVATPRFQNNELELRGWTLSGGRGLDQILKKEEVCCLTMVYGACHMRIKPPLLVRWDVRHASCITVILSHVVFSDIILCSLQRLYHRTLCHTPGPIHIYMHACRHV